MNQQQKLAQFNDDAEPAGLKLAEAPAFDNSEATWTLISRSAVIGIFFVLAIGALYLARSIVMPITAALIIGVTLSPIQKYAEQYRIPPAFTAMLLVAIFFGCLWLAVTLVAGPLAGWIAGAPEISEAIKEKLRLFDRPLAILRDLKGAIGIAAEGTGQTVAVETSLAQIGQQVLGFITPALSELVVFFGTLLFLLVGINRIRRQLVVFFETRDARLRVVRIWNEVERDLITYLATVTAVNIGLGVATGAMLFALGFPSPVAFGVLACVLNYVPYIGPATFAASLLGVGLIALPSLGSALLPPALFVGIATVEGHFITPSIVGRRLTMSPFLVFLALAFWTWLWGPAGTFMATPLLIIGLVVLHHLFVRNEQTLPG